MLDGRTNLNRRPTVERLEPRRLLAVLPAGFTETRVSLPVTFGTAIELAPDGKLFVLEQAGTMQVYSRHIGPISRLQPNFFRDAPLALNSADERGLAAIGTRMAT